MKSFIEFKESVLLEAPPEEIQAKYYSDIEMDEFEKIALADPTSIVRQDKLAKLGKFTHIGKVISDHTLPSEIEN